MTPKEQWLLLGLAIALGMGAVSLYLHDRAAAPEAVAFETRVPAKPKAVQMPLQKPAEPPPAHSAAPPENAPPITAAEAAISGGGSIDLNKAPPEELESLPGIGPKLASEIVRFRTHTPFQSVDDVIEVPGIGPKKLEGIRPLVMVGRHP